MIAARHPFRPTGRLLAIGVLALLLAGLGLRLYGLNWDRGNDLHPDELFIAKLVLVSRIHFEWPPDWEALRDPATSGLNPRSAEPGTQNFRDFAYGALPLLVTDLAAEVVSRLTGVDWHAGERVYLIGRVISALLDTLTVLVVYAIGRRVGSPRVGLLAATFAALAPMSIQLAHFFTTDSWLTFFVALAILCAIRSAEGGQLRWFFAAGGAFGLAMATKGSVFALAGLIVAAVVFDVWRRWQEGESTLHGLSAAPERIGLAGIGAFVAFALFEPYALLKPDIYLRSLRVQADIVRGVFDVPFTRQFVGTTPVVYQAEQFLRWGFGPIAGLLAVAGIAALAVRFWRGPTAGGWILLAWFAGYGLVVAVPETKFLRYLAPLIPMLAVAAGVALDALWEAIARWRGSRWAMATAAALLAGAALWTAAFESIYAHDHPRLAASRWIYANVANGSALSAEYWDDALPKNLGPGLDGRDRQYEIVTMDLYADRPTMADLTALAAAFAADEATVGIAAAIEERSYEAAKRAIDDLAPAVATWPVERRAALAVALSGGAARMSGPAHHLARAAREAADALARGDHATEARLRRLADALRTAAAGEASNYIYATLARLDYVVLSSNRVVDALPRSPWRYPVQIRYYELLRSGQLGFVPAAEFEQPPALGPLRFDDRRADESFINYDHPRVVIYRKAALVDRAAYDVLMAPALAQPVSPTRHPPRPVLALAQPVGELAAVGDARWSAALTDNTIAAVGVWVALLIALQFAGRPLAGFVLGNLADGGWGLTRLLALLVAGYAVWLGASLHVIQFRAVWCLAALVGLAVIGWVVRRRGRRAGEPSPGPAFGRAAGGAEATFWVVFWVFLAFRFVNPDGWHTIWGGEKPMEFAHLNATLRSAHFPPYDPWFAGGILNYYYYGLYLVAFCLKLTGIPAELGFNLAQPTVIALLASAGYSVAATLGRDLVGRRTGRRLATAAGLLGAVLLVGVGNLTSFVRLLGRERPPLDDFGAWTWSGSRAISNAITEFPFFTGLYADLHAHVVALPITVAAIALCYSLVRNTSEVASALSGAGRAADRARFAARLLLLMLVLGTLGATNAWDVPVYAALGGASLLMATGAIGDPGRRILIAAGLVPLLGLGSYLSFLPFHRNYEAPFSSLARVRAPTAFAEFAGHLGGLLAIVTVGLVVLLLPRRAAATASLQSPIVPILGVVAVLLVAPVAGAYDPRFETTALVGAVVLVGSVLALAAWQAATAFAARDRAGAELGWLPRLGVVVGFAAAFVALAGGGLVLATMLSLVVAAGVGWLTGRGTGERFVGLLVMAAGCIGSGVELVVVADDLIDGDWYRMNTIFKFYNQIWVLLALAGAALVVRMVRDARLGSGGAAPAQASAAVGIVGASPAVPATTATENAAPLPLRVRWARAGLAVTGVVVVASLAYPILATGPRLSQRLPEAPPFGTLNALDWMDTGWIDWSGDGERGRLSFAGDRAAIDWLNANVAGSPVVAEASIGPYRCNGSRFSIGTGLPTIIGWERHEQQQRDPATLGERVNDVRRLYLTPDPNEKEAILRRYAVAYVVVGDLERLYPIADNSCEPTGSAAGIAAFEAMVGSSLEVAFAADGTTIYRVLPDANDAAA